MGSGDGNPNDNRHGTFFQVLPTPRPYARFPFFNMMNTEDRFGALVLRPHSKITVSSEFHSLRLSNANDLWYSGGGVFQPWTFGYTGRATSGRRSLGNLYDTSVEYRATRRVTFTGYVGYTQGLAAMEQIYPQGKRWQIRILGGPVQVLKKSAHGATLRHTETKPVRILIHAICRTPRSQPRKPPRQGNGSPHPQGRGRSIRCAIGPGARAR